MSDNSHYTCKLEVAPLTGAVMTTLMKHYPDADFHCHESEKTIIIQNKDLPTDILETIRLDLLFYDRNPTLPLENLCSNLHNYIPKNDSQQEMLYYAEKLITFQDDSVGAGLYIYGEAGIGKSHVSVGVSKQFMKRGLQSNFQFADRFTLSTSTNLQPGQVWIIDDMNSGYHLSSRLFKQVVLNAHERGGRVFVTSNKDYDELMTEMFVGDSKANRVRYEDRTKGMFKILHVVGNSHRQANAWYLS